MSYYNDEDLITLKLVAQYYYNHTNTTYSHVEI